MPQRRYLGEVARLVTPSLHQHPLRLALTTGLVSAFFSVLYQAIEEFLFFAPQEQFKELIVIAITSIGMLLAIEPILERIGPVRAHESFKREDDVLIRAGAFLTIVATAFLHGLLHAHISESLSAHGMVVLEQLLTALIAPTLITLSWIYGSRREQAAARWYGLVAGLLTGLGLVVMAMVQLYFFRPAAGLREVSAGNAAIALLGVATSFLWFVVPTCAVNGYLGGLATDRRWFGRSWRAVALGLMVAAAIEVAAFSLASTLESHALRSVALMKPESLWSLFGEVIVANLGWAMGLWVRTDADALLLGSHQPEMPRNRGRELAVGVTSAIAMLGLGSLLSFGAIALGSQLTAFLLGQSS
jgi:hypothetical protein